MLNNSQIVSKVFVDDNELIDSGVINLDSSTISINLADLTLDFEFIKDDKKKPSYEGKNLDNKRFKFVFYNFYSSFVSGLFSPIEIGSIGGRKLSVSLTGMTIENSRVVFYNIYLSKEVSDVQKQS